MDCREKDGGKDNSALLVIDMKYLFRVFLLEKEKSPKINTAFSDILY
jgi:hypothetical protein